MTTPCKQAREVVLLKDQQIAYGLVPFKRNQDVIKVAHRSRSEFFASLVDGWNWAEKIPGDKEGQEIAKVVAARFPEIFRSLNITNLKLKAETAARKISQEVLARWRGTSAVLGCFFWA